MDIDSQTIIKLLTNINKDVNGIKDDVEKIKEEISEIKEAFPYGVDHHANSHKKKWYQR